LRCPLSSPILEPSWFHTLVSGDQGTVVVKRTSLEDAECPVARSLDTIGDWWSLLIVRDAFDGVRRFSDFQKGLGVSKGILTTRLRDLVARGVLKMAPASDGSAYQDYVLTGKGHELFPVIVALRQWGQDHCFRPGERHSVLVENTTGVPLARLEVRSRSGRTLTPADTTVRKLTVRARKHAAGQHRD
jgi:DNA-binding HxlR family transcriptional regulator